MNPTKGIREFASGLNLNTEANQYHLRAISAMRAQSADKELLIPLYFKKWPGKG